jgi:stringent starvation protein B
LGMTSSIPYLLRAINDWILDNQCTPYLIVDAFHQDTSVPLDHVKDGQIVLNISPLAVRDLQIEDDFVQFSGRFAGIPHEIFAPMTAVLGIVAKENNEGMWFTRPEDDPGSPKPDHKKGPPRLKIVE